MPIMNSMEPDRQQNKEAEQEEHPMNEKVFKVLGQVGASDITIGIIMIITGVSVGILAIINGARTLKTKNKSMI